MLISIFATKADQEQYNGAKIIKFTRKWKEH